MIAAKFGFGLLAFMMSGLAWMLLIGAPKMIRDDDCGPLGQMDRIMILFFRFMGVVCTAFAIGAWMYCFTI